MTFAQVGTPLLMLAAPAVGAFSVTQEELPLAVDGVTPSGRAEFWVGSSEPMEARLCSVYQILPAEADSMVGELPIARG